MIADKIKNMKTIKINTFEEFLYEEFISDYSGDKHDAVDAFDGYLEMDTEKLIKLGDKYLKSVIKSRI